MLQIIPTGNIMKTKQQHFNSNFLISIFRQAVEKVKETFKVRIFRLFITIICLHIFYSKKQVISNAREKFCI